MKTKHNRRGLRFQPLVECLEGRVLPSAVATIREATGPNPTSIQATVDAFRADLGDPNNGNTVGSQGGGRRQITWDGADNDSAPSRLPTDFFNAIAPRGVIFGGDPRIQFQQSADGANATATPIEFGNINATYPTAFATFSAPRLFTALTSNVMTVDFVIPGAATPAVTRGFGAVFTDVDVAGSTKLEFFDRTGALILQRNVLATPGDGSLSFLGVMFTTACLARVRITSGAAVLGPNDVTQTASNPDIVVMDDFIYGEPQPLPNPRIVVGAGPGTVPHVKVFDAATGALLRSFLAYGNNFRGGVRVATGDVTGDGVADVITAVGPGAGPHVKVFDGVNGTLVRSFFAFGGNFKGGVFVAAGDVNNDGRDDIIVGAGKGSVPHVKVFSGFDQKVLQSFLAYGASFKGGVTVAASDVNGDGFDDVITGTQTGVTHVKTFSGKDISLLSSFIAFGGFAGGVRVASGDVNGDGRVDIITGMGPGGKSFVNAFSAGGALIQSNFVFGVNLRGGLNVASTNVSNSHLVANIIAAPGEGGPPRVRIVGLPLGQLDGFFAFGANFLGGVWVAASR